MRVLGVVVLVTLCACSGSPPGSVPGRESFHTDTIKIDRIYRSMMGPTRSVVRQIGNPSTPQLTWLTGFRTTVANADGSEQLPQEFLCHSNLDLDAKERQQNFGTDFSASTPWLPRQRTFVISQGQVEANLPSGFGIPIVSGDSVRVLNQALNMRQRSDPITLRYDNSVSFVEDPDCNLDMTPLFLLFGQVQVSLADTDSYVGTLHPSAIQEEASCSPGEPASAHLSADDSLGQQFSYHWVLKPGEEVRHTLINEQLDLKFDTTVHYVFVHVHPYARSLKLKDLTDNKVLFDSEIELDDDGQIVKVGYYSSTEGFPLYADHDYSLISVYDNTSGVDQDAMAIIYMYGVDKAFRPPASVCG